MNISALANTAAPAMFGTNQSDPKHEARESNHASAAWSENDLVAAFRRAFLDGRIALAYQPQVCLASGEILRWEVLSRWHHGPHGAVRPDLFMAAVEHLGWGRPYVCWLLHRALLDGGRLLARARSFAFTFNLSPSDLIHDRMADDICRIVEPALAQGVEIGVEITENQPIHNVDALISNCHLLHERGIKIGLDDFGAGFSRLQHLHQLPLDFIKIDRSLLTSVMFNRRSEVVLNTIESMARALGITTVVEGVESAAQADWLIERGFNVAQGFHFGRPSNIDRLLGCVGNA